MACSKIRTGQEEVMIDEGAGERIIGRRARIAHATFKVEHQIAEYEVRLEMEERARILASAPEGLPLLAARRNECQVGPGERRSFEKMISTWTEFVLAGWREGS